jgi:hypothetical protein
LFLFLRFLCVDFLDLDYFLFVLELENFKFLLKGFELFLGMEGFRGDRRVLGLVGLLGEGKSGVEFGGGLEGLLGEFGIV